MTGNDSPVQNKNRFSFLVESSSHRFTNPYVPGTIAFPVPNIAQFDLDFPELDVLAQGDYKVTLFGDPDPTPSINRPAITRTDLSRLDGEITPAFPSGDNFEGGTFAFKFAVV